MASLLAPASLGLQTRPAGPHAQLPAAHPALARTSASRPRRDSRPMGLTMSLRRSLTASSNAEGLSPARALSTAEERPQEASVEAVDGVDAVDPSTLRSLAIASPLLALALLLPSSPASADVIYALGAEDFASGSYSPASYYSSLALFIISIPGLWSLIKRATKSKIVRRTFEVPGPATVAVTGGRSMSQVAGEITSLLNRSNFKVAGNAKEVVTFEGDITPNRSQAAFLVFCTALSLLSVALVLSITNPDVGDWWYSITLISPLAGVYYWKKATRKEQIQVKIVISDDEQTADIIMQGDDEEIERVRRDMNLMEKGLEYVKGIFE